MSRPASPAPADPKLETLLQVERRIESRVHDAEQSAARRVAEAREAARNVNDQLKGALDTEARRLEAEDIEAHTRALRAIHEEAAKRAELLQRTPEAVVERLAREAYALVITGGRPP